jgi:hypothetical protein
LVRSIVGFGEEGVAPVAEALLQGRNPAANDGRLGSKPAHPVTTRWTRHRELGEVHAGGKLSPDRSTVE